MKRLFALHVLSLFVLASVTARAGAATPPVPGEKAPDFTLTNVFGKQATFSSLTGSGPVVLIVLRGYPGYQCPFCSKQVHDFVQHAQDFAAAGAHVVMVYPGAPGDLASHATEFLKDANFPSSFQMLLDPGYTFTNAYGLRWNAAHETAYPSTFILEGDRTVIWETIGKIHGGRTTAVTVLDALPGQ